MAAEVLAESYLIAYGYAKLNNATDDRAHLFARRFDFPLTAKTVQEHWKRFKAEGRGLDPQAP